MSKYLRILNPLETMLWNRDYRIIVGMAFKNNIDVNALNIHINTISNYKHNLWMRLRHTDQPHYEWYFDHQPISCNVISGHNTLSELISNSQNAPLTSYNNVIFNIQDNKLIITTDHSGVDGVSVMKSIKELIHTLDNSYNELPSLPTKLPKLFDLSKYLKDNYIIKKQNNINNNSNIADVKVSRNDRTIFNTHLFTINYDKYEKFINKLNYLQHISSFKIGPASLFLSHYANAISNTYNISKSNKIPIRFVFNIKRFLPFNTIPKDSIVYQYINCEDLLTSINHKNDYNTILNNGKMIYDYINNPEKLLSSSCKIYNKPETYFDHKDKENNKTSLVFELSSIGNFEVSNNIIDGPYVSQYRSLSNNSVMFVTTQDRKHKKFSCVLQTSQNDSLINELKKEFDYFIFKKNIIILN